MTRRAAWLVLLGMVAAAGLRAQSSSVTVQGQVSTAGGDNEPIPHARVVLYDDKTPRALFFADKDGRFAFSISTAPHPHIVISKAGYASADIDVSAPTSASPLEVRLRPGGAISGRVLDSRGEPYSGATINLIQPRQGGDVPTLKSARTDDLGEYRLWGIPEGTDYIVELAVMQRDMLAVWYPGTDNIDRADRITVRAGVEKTGIDFVTDAAQPLPTIEGRAAMVAISAINSLVLVSGGRDVRPDNANRPLTGGSGVVRGRVTLPSGTPVPAATVTLASVNELRPSRSAPTDDDGRFVFDKLPPGEFMLGAAKLAYVTSGSDDRDTQSGVQVRLAEGEARTNVDLVLTRPAAIAGRVLDEFGEPFDGALVTVWQIRYEAGRRHLVNIVVSVNPTDDRGRYRVINVPPGRYLVAASAGTATTAQPIGDVPGYALTYFPAATTPGDAQPVDITRSTTVTDLDFALVRTPTARVSGLLTGSNESLNAVMTLGVSYRSKAIWGPSFSATRDRSGRFEFRNVPPGDYVIQAEGLRMNRSTEGDFVAQFVTVTGADISDVVLQSTPGSTIAGRLTFDGGDPPAVPDFGIVPESADLDLAPRQARTIARAELRPDLTFQINGVRGPRRIAVTDSPGGWTLKSVYANGVDVTDRALPFGQPQQSLTDVEVVLTNRLTELTGGVTDRRGEATRNYSLLVFSTDRDRWYPGSRYFRRAAPDGNGSFLLRGLPPGDYHVAALAAADVPREGETAWQDPEFLESIAGRTVFATLTEGQKLSISARLITP
jgi:protocatechuate 3,4-dioxygenase beta subunit